MSLARLTGLGALLGIGVVGAITAARKFGSVGGRAGDDAGDEGGGSGGGTTLFPELTHAAFPVRGRPGAAVRIPSGYNASRPLDVAIYFHGWTNCVTTVVSDVDHTCTAGQSVRPHSSLGSQFDSSGANAILVVPQLKFLERSGAPGSLGRAGGLEALLAEILGGVAAPHLGGARRVSDVRSVSLMSHSGGYYAMASVLRVGDLRAQVREVCLLDSLYGDRPTFEGWVRGAQGRRLINIYTASGGTANNSRAQRAALSAVGDDTGRADPAGGYGAPIIVQRSRLDHTGVTRYYPERLWAAGPFDRR